MESVKSTPKRSSTLRSFAAALLLFPAAALFPAGCAIEDHRESHEGEGVGHRTAFTRTSWSKEDRMQPRAETPYIPKPKETSREGNRP
jgi:hypothetical protein